MTYRKKLIEVSLPLEAINKECEREAYLTNGHPNTLHRYWARRRLASCRATIFATVVDDPSSWPEYFKDEQSVENERDELHLILRELSIWENSNNKWLLYRAMWKIAESVSRNIGVELDGLSPPSNDIVNPMDFDNLFNWLQTNGPIIVDPFCGGGAIPLEAQRLGLRSIGSDLNPVAVMITKAGIEIPGASQLIINKISASDGGNNDTTLANLIRKYGKELFGQVNDICGNLYANRLVTKEDANERPDLKNYVGRELEIIGFFWARTIPSPNPAYLGKFTPISSTFQLTKAKKGRHHWSEYEIQNGEVVFTVKRGVNTPDGIPSGNKLGRGGNFTCLISGSPIDESYVEKMGKEGKMSSKLFAIVCKGDKERVFLTPNNSDEINANVGCDIEFPDIPMASLPRWFSPPRYGMTRFCDLFSTRQKMVNEKFCETISSIKENIHSDLNSRYSNCISESELDYLTSAIVTYLAFAFDKGLDYWCSAVGWDRGRDSVRPVFVRQAIQMTWDYFETNPFSTSTGNFLSHVESIARAVEVLPRKTGSHSIQLDAKNCVTDESIIIVTDPPYYDNIGYADLSDFFYPWMARNLKSSWPKNFTTIATPKSDELVAIPERFGGKKKAEGHFSQGLSSVFQSITENYPKNQPMSIYYAFKQSELKQEGLVSVGWSSFLSSIIDTGLMVTSTLPSRTERAAKLIGKNANKLSSSIVLTCRIRDSNAPTIRRTDFIAELRNSLASAVRDLQEGGISPVDLAQAAIGPGIGVFSKYRAVMNLDGSHMSVQRALAIINEELSVILGETDDKIDDESRTCFRWFLTHNLTAKPYGELDVLARAISSDPKRIEESGCMIFSDGKVRIAEIDSYPESFNPKDVGNAPAWAHVHRLIRLLDVKGESEAAAYMRHMPSHQRDSVRSLTYRLYQICDEKKMMQQAKNYNTLAVSWGQVADRSQKDDKDFRQSGLDEY